MTAGQVTEDQVFATLTEVLAEVVPGIEASAVTRDDRLRDLGANSIDRAEILTESMERLGIRLPMVSFGNSRNIGDIVQTMAGEGAA